MSLIFKYSIKAIPPSNNNFIGKNQRWQYRFQRWSNKESQNGLTSRGKCGYGTMCDYCDNNTYGNPCVRALNKMLKEKCLSIDYGIADFDDIWYGRYWRKE